MKKLYEKPVAEKIQFDYSAQVVAASNLGKNDWIPSHGGMANFLATGCWVWQDSGCRDMQFV